MGKVRGVLERRLPGEGRIGVAVSGGSDSMCLLDCLLRFGLVPAGRIAVVNVDHGIRGEESERDSAFVAGFCRERGLRLIFRKADVPALAREQGAGLEAAARTVRRELFSSLLSTGEVSAILTAHNACDRTETVLMHIFRGSGLRGLVGMTERDGDIVRPLIGCTKDEINDYVAAFGVPYVEDSTNADTAYTRNFLRREVLPLLRGRYPGLDTAVARLSDAAAELPSRSGGLIAPGADGADVIAAFLDAGLTADFSRRNIDDTLALLDKQPGRGVDLPHGFRAEREGGGVRVSARVQAIRAEKPFAYGTTDFGFAEVTAEECEPRVDKTRTVFDADKLPAGAVVRTRRDGDRFRPVGGHEKLLSDWLTDRKLPLRVKRGILCLAHGGEVLAVIGMATGEKIKIDEKTERAAVISVRAKGEDT